MQVCINMFFPIYRFAFAFVSVAAIGRKPVSKMWNKHEQVALAVGVGKGQQV